MCDIYKTTLHTSIFYLERRLIINYNKKIIQIKKRGTKI